jgi:colanic acid/amylovoran biosynthesis glycosyltransferase
MIAYIVNQYPKVNHTFIRREILAIEKAGQTIRRFALRGWDAELVDRADITERDKTTYILRRGLFPLIRAALTWLLFRPDSFFKALRLTTRMIPRSDRSATLHAITLCEACYMGQIVLNSDVRHIHAHFGTNSAEVAMLVSALTGIPYSFTVHGPEEFERPEFIKLRTKVEKAKFVVAISNFGASQIYRWADLRDWRKVKIVRCGIEQDYGGHARHEPSNPDRLVTIGRISMQKGHLLLVEAAARVMKERDKFQLIVVGDGELRAEVEALIKQKGLEGRISIIGWASGERVRAEIVRARGLVLASFSEGLPVVIMEAMALGRVILATHVAGIPELVRPGETGWLFPPGSVAAAADAIRECLSTPIERCYEMGERGRKLVAEQHDIDRESAFLSRLFRCDPNTLAERTDFSLSDRGTCGLCVDLALDGPVEVVPRFPKPALKRPAAT